MKKTIKTLFCAILLIVMVLTMATCGNGGTQKQLDDLQAILIQQQEQPQQLEELLKQQKEKNGELELKYFALVEDLQKLQASVDRLEKSTPYEVTAVVKSSANIWYKPATSYLIYTQEQLQQMLVELDIVFENIYNTDG